MTGSGRTPIVVLGMMTKMPVAGVVWQTLHYLLGFQRLGYDVYYVETHARTPSMLMAHEDDDSSALAAAFIAETMRHFGFENRWGYVALHDDGQHFGLTEGELHRVYDSAALILNLHGGTYPRPELARTGRLVYLETDPVQLQVELHAELAATRQFLEPHSAFFTFAENLGGLGCTLPCSSEFEFHATRQPVVCEVWETSELPTSGVYTTVGNWRQLWRDVTFGGERYGWSKHAEWDKFLDMPARTSSAFELALASYDARDRALIESHGWSVTPAAEISTSTEAYRTYIQRSLGEFTVAKEQNVRFRTGWFSDRSATYLAAGRPVITQDTGFGAVLPTGEGLMAFSTLDEAVEAVETVESAAQQHRTAATEIARECFDADGVLGRLLEVLGLPRRAVASIPLGLRLTPVARRPLRLESATVEQVLALSPVDGSVPASVVVVAFGDLPLTKLCLESVLANTDAPDYEVVVVDNGSSETSQAYLDEVERRFVNVRIVRNRRNEGFASATNIGLAAAKGEALVLLNNDTIVSPGWLGRLLGHLEDPAVGLVGPATNRSGTEAEVPTWYETYGELLSFAAERAGACAGRTRELPTPTMFCLAMRRDTFERIGPLDERFEVGMLEDDDYAMRVRQAGLASVCAEDVFVHHFGEGSFGDLVPTGEHARLLEANKRRFEDKWGSPWRPYGRGPDERYQDAVAGTRAAIEEHVPPGAMVAVVSKGDDRLTDIVGRTVWHFPRADGGLWAGHHPGDSDDAVRELLRVRAQGVTHIAFPQPSMWWLDFYSGLASHLEQESRVVIAFPECKIYAFQEARS